MGVKLRCVAAVAAVVSVLAGCQEDGSRGAGDPGGAGHGDRQPVLIYPSHEAAFAAVADEAGLDVEEHWDSMAIVVDDQAIQLLIHGSSSCPPEPEHADFSNWQVDEAGAVEVVELIDGSSHDGPCTDDLAPHYFELDSSLGWSEGVDVVYERAGSDGVDVIDTR